MKVPAPLLVNIVGINTFSQGYYCSWSRVRMPDSNDIKIMATSMKGIGCIL